MSLQIFESCFICLFFPHQTPRGMFEGPDKYDEYLLQLQYKNR